MNINFLFSIILVGLLAIFFLFKPSEVKQKVFHDVPLFELNEFTLHELNKEGIITFMDGKSATRYSNRYTLKYVNYTDNSKEYIAHMKANEAEYKDHIVDLKGDVVYVREDGLTFKTQEVLYNKNTHIASANSPYKAFRGTSFIEGENLIYNNILDTLKSKKVFVQYKIGDRI